MNTRSVSQWGALVGLLFLLGSCMSPLTNLTKGVGEVPLGKNEVRLVFNTSSNNRSAEGATFLTVQLESLVDGTVKFASATGVSGAYTITVGGMIGGEWKLRARFWNNDVDKSLLYYGNTKELIVPGQAKVVNLVVYPVGSLGSVNVVDALMPHHVSVLGQDGQPSNAVDKKLGVGTTWSLDGITYSDVDETIPASTPGVLWSSDKENVAVVSPSGRVTILGLGSAVITATSIIDPAYSAIYKIEGVSPVYGSWKFGYQDYNYNPNTSADELTYWEYEVFRFTNTQFTNYRWDSEGDAESVRGTFTLQGGLLTMEPTQVLDTLMDPPQWKPVVGGNYEKMVTYVDLSPEVLVMSPLNIYGPKAALGRATNGGYSKVLYRTAEKSLSGVTVGGEVSSFNLPVGMGLDELGVVTSPADATVGGVVWVSNGPTVVGPQVGNDRLVGLQEGSTQVRAYPLDADYDGIPGILSTLQVYVVANPAPVVTMTSSAYTTQTGYPSFNFTATDATGLGQISWSMKDMNSGYPIGNGTVNNVTGTNLNFALSNSSQNLYDGHYQFQITAVDKQGMGSGLPQMFDFWVDTAAPTIAGSFEGAQLTPGAVNSGLTITFSDPISGVKGSSFVATNTIGALSLWSINSASYVPADLFVSVEDFTGDTVTLTIDLSAYAVGDYPYGNGTLNFDITDNAGNVSSHTVSFDIGSLP